MSGLLTYPQSNRRVSQDVGYAILQAGKQGYLTDELIAAATGADDLIADVLAAVVGPGAESFSQRNSIARALKIGQGLGDLSNDRVQGASSVQTLAELTWVTDDPSYLTGHLGVNLIP
jgi:hypothetical protein